MPELKGTGSDQVQPDVDPFRKNPNGCDAGPNLFAENGIREVAGMFRRRGKDATTLDSVRRTGGVVPDATRQPNWDNAQSAVPRGGKVIDFHAGFLPHDRHAETGRKWPLGRTGEKTVAATGQVKCASFFPQPGELDLTTCSASRAERPTSAAVTSVPVWSSSPNG